MRFSVCLFVLLPCLVSSQDISSFRKGNLFKKSAYLSLSYNGSYQSRDTAEVNSSGYLASFRGNLELFSIQIPIHLTFRTGRFTAGFSNPFVRFGMSPSYRWIKLHLGHRVMQFSNYSLNGITFLGAGVELTPGLFRFSGLYGTVKTPNYHLDSLAFYSHLIQDYRRSLYGMKLGFGKDRRHIDFHFLKTKDDYIANTDSLINRTIFPPAENLVLGAKGKFAFLQGFQFEVNADLSTLTNNQLAREDSLQDKRSRDIQKFVDPFMTTNNTTRANLAYDASLQYNHRFINVGIVFKHIDPNYRSFGMHYIQDDVEDITLRLGLRAWKNKLVLNTVSGWQKSNLNSIRRNTSKKTILSANAMVAPHKNFALQGSFSNFTMDQSPGIAQLNDTFRLVRNTAVLQLSPQLKFGSANWPQQLGLSYQQSELEDVSPLASGFGTGKVIHYSLNYNVQARALKASMSLGLLTGTEQFEQGEQRRSGANLSFSKNFEKPKLAFRAGGGYYRLIAGDLEDGNTLNFSLSCGYSINTSLSVNTSLAYLDKSSLVTPQFKDWRLSINLNYSLFQNKQYGSNPK
ncbi:MAG: hypothetical protein KBF37_07290 [Saprospiraceae bacterium]|jgi:hypothetical protein|nr:hypothetical protein [Saprospiraceae bacterium]